MKRNAAHHTAAVAKRARSACRLPAPLREGEKMHSTRSQSASKRKWLALTPRAQHRDPSLSYCSTDGSSTGWHSAVFVPRTLDGVEPLVRLRARWGDMKGSRNVGAEASGFLLGVETVAAHEPATAVEDMVFLADFLNALAWDCGAANFKHEVLVAAYGEVKNIKASKLPQHSHWDRVHHPGHQTDDSWYTKLNQAADNLASLKMDVDVRVPLSVLMGVMTTQGKKAGSACRAAIEAAAVH